MTATRIEFLLDPGFLDRFPHPYPATKVVPDWFKQMPAETEYEGQPMSTVKICPPFLEAMTCGYIIPLPADTRVAVDEKGGLFAESQERIILFHKTGQFRGAPFDRFPVLKLINPWLIRTPPGYSTLFLEPLNRFGPPIHPLAGMVETDRFFRQVNFPCVVTLRRGASVDLPRGTPLVQVIPFKREDFHAEVLPLNMEQCVATQQKIKENPHFYKEECWTKKKFS